MPRRSVPHGSFIVCFPLEQTNLAVLSGFLVLCQIPAPLPDYCRLANHGPFVIAPLKEEVLSEKPRVSLFHDILSEKQINVLKKLAKPKVSLELVGDSCDPSLCIQSFLSAVQLDRAGGFGEFDFEDTRVSHT